MIWRSCGGATAMTLVLVGCFGEAPPTADCVDSECDDTQTTTGMGASSTGGVTSATQDSASQTGTSTGVSTVSAGSESESGGSGGVDSSTTDTAGVCGDGVVDPGEDCDDQNDAPYDGCRECRLTLALGEQFVLDVDDRADSVLALTRDGATVIAGGRTATQTEGLDALWFRVADGILQPPNWYHVASLPSDNVVEAVGRGPGVCAVAGFISTVGVVVPAANLVACDDGTVGAAFPILATELGGSGAIHAMVIDASGTIYLGGEWTTMTGTHGFVQQFTSEAVPGPVTWFDDTDVFGGASRVLALALDEGGEVYVGGSWSDGGTPLGFYGRIDIAASNPIAFGGPAAASEVAALAVRSGSLWAAGWAEAATRDAIVELQSDDTSGPTPPLAVWSLALPSDSRATGLASLASGVAVVGVTATATHGDDLVVAVLGDDATETMRAVFDGPGSGDDAANAVVVDGNAIYVGGHVTVGAAPDLLIQHWQLPDP